MASPSIPTASRQFLSSLVITVIGITLLYLSLGAR